MKTFMGCGIALAVSAVSVVGFADKAENYRKTGGMVERPNSAKGSILVVNAQKKLPKAWFDNAAKALDAMYHFKFKVVTLEKPVELAEARNALKAENAPYGVVVTALDAKLPPLIALPDDQCAVINAAAMPEDEGAFVKQVSRAFALACGGCGSQYPATLMGPFSNARKLAAYPGTGLPADVVIRVKNTLRADGISPCFMTTYKMACREGWAPEPGTNEVWKAIWNEARSEKERGPSNAIEIKPPKK